MAFAIVDFPEPGVPEIVTFMDLLEEILLYKFKGTNININIPAEKEIARQ